MSRISSLSVAVPDHKYSRDELCRFAEKVYCHDASEARKLKFLYAHSGIENRYSVIPDYAGDVNDRQLYPPTEDLEPFPSIESRLKIYDDAAAKLSEKVARASMGARPASEITHLITISCTGMSAPGLDLQLMESLGLRSNVVRTSVNFMGCYAAIHGLKLADAFCAKDENAKVLIVCVELCTLHFQKTITNDNITSSLLFGDGAAACIVSNEKLPGFEIRNFYSEVNVKGKSDMAWQISSSGFLMTLSGYVPDLVKADIAGPVNAALKQAGVAKDDIDHWCIHPGGKKILESIQSALNLSAEDLKLSYDVLRDYGNMSSPTVLFVLKKIEDFIKDNAESSQSNESGESRFETVFCAAFGPGLTTETLIATYG